jgi:hypothetical protein
MIGARVLRCVSAKTAGECGGEGSSSPTETVPAPCARHRRYKRTARGAVDGSARYRTGRGVQHAPISPTGKVCQKSPCLPNAVSPIPPLPSQNRSTTRPVRLPSRRKSNRFPSRVRRVGFARRRTWCSTPTGLTTQPTWRSPPLPFPPSSQGFPFHVSFSVLLAGRCGFRRDVGLLLGWIRSQRVRRRLRDGLRVPRVRPDGVRRAGLRRAGRLRLSVSGTAMWPVIWRADSVRTVSGVCGSAHEHAAIAPA